MNKVKEKVNGIMNLTGDPNDLFYGTSLDGIPYALLCTKRYKVFVISCLKKNEERSGLIRGQSIEDDTVVIYTVNCYSEAKATSYIEQCKEELTKGINTCIINFPNSPQYFSTRKLPAEAVANPDEYLKQGDLVLTTMFLGLRHSGIYLGNGEVAHVSGHGTSILFARTGRLVPDFVSPGGKLWILECVFRFRDPTRIVEVAREYTENEVPQWKYHIMMRNCQHFTSICAFGFNYSGRIYYR